MAFAELRFVSITIADGVQSMNGLGVSLLRETKLISCFGQHLAFVIP
jgi:hypothetical protein